MDSKISEVELEAFAKFLGADTNREEGYLEVYVGKKTFRFEEKDESFQERFINCWILFENHTSTEIHFTHARCVMGNDYGWLDLYNEGIYVGKLNIHSK